jgi:hypothetical protein
VRSGADTPGNPSGSPRPTCGATLTDARKEQRMEDTFTVVVIGVAAVLGWAAFVLAWGLRQGPGEQKSNH